MLPTQRQSELPSIIPSILPSTASSSSPAPSLIPTKNLICSIEQVLGETYYFALNNACWKLELFENGILEFDGSDTTCSNPTFTSSRVVSVYDSVNIDTNEVKYVSVSEGQYSGIVRFRQSSTVTTGLEVKMLSLSGIKKEFIAEIKTPSCESTTSTLYNK